MEILHYLAVPAEPCRYAANAEGNSGRRFYTPSRVQDSLCGWGGKLGDRLCSGGPPNLKADYAPAHQPFNNSGWRDWLLKEENGWVYGVPPAMPPAVFEERRPA